jgi:hypothetical protein
VIGRLIRNARPIREHARRAHSRVGARKFGMAHVERQYEADAETLKSAAYAPPMSAAPQPAYMRRNGSPTARRDMAPRRPKLTLSRTTGQASRLYTLRHPRRRQSMRHAASRMLTGPPLPGAGVEHATRANDAALRSAASGLPVQA